MRHFHRIFLVALLALAACNFTLTPKPSPLLRTFREIHPDGTVSEHREKDLTHFQRLARARIPASPAIQELYLLEVDLPAAEGNRGAYVAIYRSAKSAQFCYFEQFNHLPRADRYFHRQLTADELAAFMAFLRANPIDTLHTIHPIIPEENPTTVPAATEPATTEPADPGIIFRFTDATLKSARTLILPNPAPEDHPTIDLIQFFSRFRDAAPLACTYIQPIPSTATLLYADPIHHVERVWTDGDDLRALIFPPLPNDPRISSATQPAATTIPQPAPESEPAAQTAPASTEPTTAPAESWYTFRDDTWSPAVPPPIPDTEPIHYSPSTAPAPAPVLVPATTEPGATSQPVKPYVLANPGRFPPTETWSAEPGPHFTTVWHYLPFDHTHGQWLGFVVPAFVFDQDHFAISKSQKLLYLIHDGQLFSLPIPPAAL